MQLLISNCEIFGLSMRGSVSVVKSFGGRGALVMVTSELVGGTSSSWLVSWALILGLEQDAHVILRRKYDSNWFL